jgi:hypothetical protein
MQTHMRGGGETSHTCVHVCVCVCVFVCVCVRGRTGLFPTRHESENSCRSQRLRVPVGGTHRHIIYMRKDHVLIGHDEIMELQQSGCSNLVHISKYTNMEDRKYEKEDTYSLIVAYL